MSVHQYDGFSELEQELTEIINNVENPIEILETGAKEFVKDLMKLPKPMSSIRHSSYTHLVDSFSYATKDNEIEVGWGKYYGRMVEEGTKKTPSQPHLVPLFEKNKNKYYEGMIGKIYKI